MSSDTWRRFELLLSETSSVIIFIGLAIKMLPGMLCMPCNKCHRQGREKWTDVLYTFATCTFLHGRSPSFKLCPLKKLEKEEATAVAIEREREKSWIDTGGRCWLAICFLLFALRYFFSVKGKWPAWNRWSRVYSTLKTNRELITKRKTGSKLVGGQPIKCSRLALWLHDV